MNIKTQAHINSLKGAKAEVTILEQMKPDTYLVDYNGIKCTAIYNWFSCEYYADDVYGIVEK